MDTAFLKEALFYGASASAFKLGTVLTGGWFWVRVKGCTLLYRGDDINTVDFSSIIAVGDFDAARINPPAYIRHSSDSVYFYVVRRVSNFGMAQQTFSAAAKVEIDTEGNLISPRPNSIFKLNAKQLADNKVQLVWFYCPLGQKSKPSCFKVYCDNNPVAAIKYAGRKFYSYTSDSLSTGTYLFAIRAEDLAGTQSFPSQIKIQVGNVNSTTITISQARAI